MVQRSRNEAVRRNLHGRLVTACAAGMAAVAIALLGLPSVAASATAPPAVPNVRVTAAGFDTLSLAWDPVDSADFYRVLVDGVWRSGVYDPETAVTVTQLKPGTTYTVEVQAQSDQGDFGPGSSVTAATKPDDEPPTPPTNLRETRNASNGSTGLTWDESTDNWAVHAGYRIFADGRQVFVDNPPTEWFWLVDPYWGGLTCGQTYTFTVKAMDKAGHLSAASAPLRTTIPTC